MEFEERDPAPETSAGGEETECGGSPAGPEAPDEASGSGSPADSEAPGGTPDIEDVQSPPAAAGPQTVVPRWIQAIVLPLALLGLYALARACGPVVPVVVIASIIALVLNPLVKRYQRVLPHGLAIALAYLSVLALFVGIGVLLFIPVADQINHFSNNVPELTRKANSELDSIQSWLGKHGIKLHIQKQGQTALEALQKQVLKRSGSIVSFSKNVLSTLLTLSIYGLITLVLSIYLLAYSEGIGELFRRLMPRSDGTAHDDYPLLVQKAVTGYVRGQILFTLVMGASFALLMWFLGAVGLFHDGSRYALFFGAFYGLMELIPYVGPIIGPVPALAVALFSHPVSALWVLIAAVALQQLEGHVVAPQIFRISLRINPILVILALLIGDQIWGIAGALVALPAATVIRQTVLYLREHLVLEPWERNPPAPSPPAAAPPT